MSSSTASSAHEAKADRRLKSPETTPSAIPESPAPEAMPSRMRSPDIVALQRQIGARATARMLQKKSAAQPLPSVISAPLSGLLGGDSLSGVRVHTGEQADDIARSADSDAKTLGRDIYFRAGAYQPGTARGNAVIAREVAHAQYHGSGIPSREASGAQRRDAEGVGELVGMMGETPANILQPARGEPTPIQGNVLQRGRKMAVAGMVTSKAAQGLFTTVLGPLSLAWRWPLIQKNMGETLGEDFGTRKYTDPNKKKGDKYRYGTGKLGEAMRFISLYTELLKEVVIWCGFASFVAAIVAAATHGVAAPVFVGISIVTAALAGVLFLLKSSLVALNGYRLWKLRGATGTDADTERAFIKHQMITDGLDGLSALLTTVFAALGAGGVSATAGSALSKLAGVGSSEPISKLASSGLNTVTQGIGTGIVTNTMKEGGKETVKPGKETGFFGIGSKTKDDWGGFGKDGVEIKNAYKGLFGRKKKTPVTPQQGGSGLSQDGQQALAMSNTLVTASSTNLNDQRHHSVEAQDGVDTIETVSPKAIQGQQDVNTVRENLEESHKQGESIDDSIESSVDQSVTDENQVDDLERRVNEGLAKTDEAPIEKPKDTDTDIQMKPSKPGIFKRLGGWFMSKLRGVKGGVRRLQNWLMRGLLKFITRFDKSDTDPNAVSAAMAEEKTFAAATLQKEKVNDEKFGKYREDALEANAGIRALAQNEQAAGSDDDQ